MSYYECIFKTKCLTLVTLLGISSVRKEKTEEFEKKNGGSL